MFNRYGKITLGLAVLMFVLSTPYFYDRLPAIHSYIDSTSMKIIAGILFVISLYGKVVGGCLIFVAIGNLVVFFMMGASDYAKLQQSLFLLIFGGIAVFIGSEHLNERFIKDSKKVRKSCRACNGQGGKWINNDKFVICNNCDGTGSA